MTAEPPSSYAVKLRPYSDKYSHTTPGQYLEIPIPDEIEQLGVEHGDTVYLDFVSAQDPAYIRISFSDTGTRHDLKLKYRDDLHPKYAVTLPIEYTVHRDDSPFKGLGRDDTVTVEFNYGSQPEVRIYTEEGYRKRTTQLVTDDLTPTLKAPALASLLNIFRIKPDINLTQKTRVRGDGFEFIPFNILDPALEEWIKNASRPDEMEELYSGSRDIIRYSDLMKLYRSGALDTDLGAVISIRWLKSSSGSDDSKIYEYAHSDTFDGSYRAVLPRGKTANVVVSTEDDRSVLELYREDSTWVVGFGEDRGKKPIQVTPSSSRYQEIFVPIPVKVEGGPEFECTMYLQRRAGWIREWYENNQV
jgi:hypothetical protein